MPNVTLYSWGAADGLESASPYCLKTLYALRYKKIPHETKIVSVRFPGWARRGTLPIAEIAGRRVEDSTHILKALDGAYPESPRLYPAEKAARAETILLEDWADEVLFLTAFYYRWAIEPNFRPFFAQLTGSIPGPIRAVLSGPIRKSALKVLKARGIAHDTEEERRLHFNAALDALESRLEKNRFLVHDAPTAADFAAYGPLALIEAARFPELTPLMAGRKPLGAWMSSMREVSHA